VASVVHSPNPSFAIIGSPGCRRIERFQAALMRLDLPPATVVPWTELLAGKARLETAVPSGAVVRIESPGKEFEVERALLLAGAEVAEEGFERMSPRAIREMTFDRGRILPSRQWYLGFCRALRWIEQQLADCPPHRLMSHPCEIEMMFDKPRCHERLTRAGIAVPPCLGVVPSYEALRERMREAGCARVFVKLAHGSSASGVVAYQTNGHQHQATTTVEMVRREGTLCLYNSRRIRVYREPGEIAALIDALCRHRAHTEAWLPKAGLDGRVFDLRVVVIAGQAQHAVVRSSRSPMTNLHLLNERGDLGALQARMGPEAWAVALRTCERAAGCFPGILCAGIDLLIAPGFRRHAVLEVNAFGDLLPGVLWEGRDTYTAEVVALFAGRALPKGREEGCLMAGPVA
jgi:hypothetical protein